MSDGSQLGFVERSNISRIAIPKELKKIEVIFFSNETYLYNIKFYTRDGREISLTQGIAHGPSRVETVEFEENEHLLSCELYTIVRPRVTIESKSKNQKYSTEDNTKKNSHKQQRL